MPSAVYPPRAHCGTLRLVIVFVCRVRVYTRGLARSLARPFTAARSFRPLVLCAIRPRSALVGCHPARHGGNPGLGPGPSSAGRREGESNAEGERGRRDLVGLSREAGSPMHVCRGTGSGRSRRMGLEIAHARRNPSNERASERQGDVTTNLLRSSSFLLLRSGWTPSSWSSMFFENASAIFSIAKNYTKSHNVIIQRQCFVLNICISK